MPIRLFGMLSLLALILAQPGLGRDAANPAGLRAAALAAVNQDRIRHGLPPLRLNERLNAIAQAHAEDMLRRQYYDHASPEGHMAGDRFQAHGGSRWRLVEENIYRCTNCAEAPDAWHFERAWMESPSHRENILRHGLTDFGFGIANIQGDVVYAVQTFAGPGVPRGTDAAEAAEVIAPAAQTGLLMQRINAARHRAGLPPMQASSALTAIARRMVSNDAAGVVAPEWMRHFYTLSNEDTEWQEVRLETSRCGGCGVRATAADVVSFADEFVNEGARDANPMAPDLDLAGFAMSVDGNGMKSAVLLVARRR